MSVTTTFMRDESRPQRTEQGRRVDSLSRKARSRNMARIGSCATSPERVVARLLRQRGLRPKQNVESLAGTPDFVFPRRRKIIFVHGCFWHRHTCRRGQSFPSTNVPFWRAKLQQNASRDKRVQRNLRKLGWQVMIIWECQTNDEERLSLALMRFLRRP